MECPVDPNMSITGVTHAKWYGAPAPMFCGPKTEYPFTGFWNYNYECKCGNTCTLLAFLDEEYGSYVLLLLLPGNKGWANPPESCDVYEGQKAGKFDDSTAYANTG